MSIVTAHEGVNRVPKSWYASAGGVNRKLKSIFAARDGVNRKIYSATVSYTGASDPAYPAVYGKAGDVWSPQSDGQSQFNVTWSFAEPVVFPAGTEVGCYLVSYSTNQQSFTATMTFCYGGAKLEPSYSGQWYNASGGGSVAYTSAQHTADAVAGKFSVSDPGLLLTMLSGRMIIGGQDLTAGGELEI